MDGNIKNVSLCNKLELYKRKDLLFVLIISLVFTPILTSSLSNERYILSIIVGVTYVFSYVAIALLNYWNPKFNLFVAYQPVQEVSRSEYIFVEAEEYHGKSAILPLDLERINGEKCIFFEFQKIKYFYNDLTNRFEEYIFGENKLVKEVFSLKGLQTKSDIQTSELKYGLNIMNVDIPNYSELLIERIYSPMFIFQVFSCVLLFLDEYWYFSLFSLSMLIMFEMLVVFQQTSNMKTIRSMQNSVGKHFVYREKVWTEIDATLILPGDVVSLNNDAKAKVFAPCDIVLLRGNCLVDESSLTGESVPQIKEPVEEILYENIYNYEQFPKVHMISCGSIILNSYNVNKKTLNIRGPPDGGCIGICVKNGFSTSKGRLLKTIMFSVNHVPNNNLETGLFLLFLFIFALIASSYVWIKGTQDPTRSKYKILLECVIILTSVVPSELPVELSLAINNSMIKLTKKNIFCTEPYRIPFAGKTNFCCFDKTGTLTEENLKIEGVVCASNTLEASNIVKLEQLNDIVSIILCGCHSLSFTNEILLGDPLEKSCLDLLGARLSGSDLVTWKNTSLQIIKRFPFASKLKRMSALISFRKDNSIKLNIPLNSHTEFSDSSPNYMYIIKGAPEVLHPMFVNAPENYKMVYRNLTLNGYRVLALGFKLLKDFDCGKISGLLRDDGEKDLIFSGFLVAGSKLKSDTIICINEIVNSLHLVVMITGDNSLTACHVAKEAGFCSDKDILLLEKNEDNAWKWSSFSSDIAGENYVTFDPLDEFPDSLFCLTGEGFRFIISDDNRYSWLVRNIRKVVVYARVDPEEKEMIIKFIKKLDQVTLMCGDGTNDMGALRQADVGIAMLNNLNKRIEIDNTVSVDTSSNGKKASRPVIHRNRSSKKELNILSKQNKKSFKEIMEELKKSQEAESIVKLGDASIAAPFTSKLGKLRSVCDILLQGRCALVTTLQMFRILAINSLVTAYSQSVHYSHGIRTSDYQASIQAIIITFNFFAVSNSDTAMRLTRNLPLVNIFNSYMILSITAQSFIHLVSFLLLSHYALSSSYTSLKFDIDSKFEPNILNSVIFIAGIAVQVTTFAVNYHGKPFMASWQRNTKLRNSILATYTFIVCLIFNVVPELNESLKIVPFSYELKITTFLVLLGNFILSFGLDSTLYKFLGERKLF